ncbi:MAG: outer membrane lipoprotein SlyB [Francisella sp.]
MILISLALLSGCASDGPSYSANSIGQVSNIKQGKIIDIQVVNIKGRNNVGSRIGGIAGGATEKALTSSQAYQFIIQLNYGKSIAVLQEEVKGLSVGDDVTILASGNNTRIIPQG